MEKNDTAQTIELQILKAKYHEKLLAAETAKHGPNQTQERMRNHHGNYHEVMTTLNNLRQLKNQLEKKHEKISEELKASKSDIDEAKK